ncbi:growth hormone secretagogue receptor type 1-like [Penaeus monodon]|uniref:growth hormone secretagogue receptor type 1-like n=1 Tax=Penaeus monodon TaxID=6687 RepID=UPI0018A7A71F|nr:growth hormone secretagogue receptor type 1-like [Penaeus monodon]
MEFGLGLVTAPPDPECASGECDGFVVPHTIPSPQTATVNSMFPSVTTSSPATDVEPPEDADGLPNLSFPAYMQGIYTTWCLVLLLVGLAGNILVPVLVLRDRELRGASTSIFIVNLVAADLLVLVVCLPALLCELYAPPDVWVLPPSMCKVVPYVEFTVAHASMLTILAISVERYRAICHPLTAAATCSRARATAACLLVWVLATSITSPVIALTEYERTNYVDDSVVPVCYTRIDKLWAKVFVVSSMVVLFFLPLIILVLLYWRIARQLLLEDKQLCRDKPNPNLQARKQVVVMLGTVVVVFFVCLLPYRVFSLWIIFTSKETEQSLGQEVHFNLLYATRTLVYVNSAINPVLYNVTSSKFRGAFFRLLGLRGADGTTSSTHQTTTTTTASASLSSTLNKSRHPWKSQRLLVRCSYTCLSWEGETRPLVDRRPARAATWASTNAAIQQSPAASPFLARAPCTRAAVKEAESFV